MINLIINSSEQFNASDEEVFRNFVYNTMQDFINQTSPEDFKNMNSPRGVFTKCDSYCIDITAWTAEDEDDTD